VIWVREGLRLLARSPMRSVLLVLCWSLTLLLAGALGWGLRHSNQFRAALTGRVPAECYLAGEGGTADAAVRRFLEGSRTLAYTGRLSRAEAAAEFAAGFGVDVVALLGENPFPPTVLMRVRPGADPARLDEELARLAAVPGVEGVHVDRQLLGEVGRQLARMGRVLVAAAAVLALFTAALLAAAVRGLQRAYRAEAQLLVYEGARPWQLTLPPLVALLLPAMLTVLLVLTMSRAMFSTLQWIGLGDHLLHTWPLLLGVCLPVAAAALVLAIQARRVVLAGRAIR